MTQGLVSITVNGVVTMKLVTGCDGYNAPALAANLRALGRVPSIDEAHALATRHEFGAGASLVIQTPTEDRSEDGDPLPPLYRAKFADPRFNPRWDYGTAEYVEVVEF